MATRVALPAKLTNGPDAERLWLTLVAAVGLVLAASLTWLLVQSPGKLAAAGSSPASSGHSTSAGQSGGSPGGAPSHSSGASGSSSSSSSTKRPPAAAAAPGTFPIFVVAQPTPSGDLDVVEELFENKPVSTLRLTLPSAQGVAALTGMHARASKLTVLADGRAVPSPSGGTITKDTTLRLGRPSATITLTYTLSGVVVHTGPGPKNRVLAALPPLTRDRSSSVPAVVRVVGSGVLNLICPQLDASEQLCGRQDGEQWTTPAIPGRSGQVIAQLNLGG